MSKLVLSLLGGFRVAVDENPVLPFESDKVRAMLAYLAVEAEQVHRRESLACLFWPDKSDPLARRSLSQTLYNLQNIIGNRQVDRPFLTINQQDVQFNLASKHDLDTKTFSRLATEHHNRHSTTQECQPCLEGLQEAVEIYSGELLKGFSLSDSPPFEEWLLLSRERYNRLYTDLLQQLVVTFAEQQKYENAIPYYQRWIENDPYQEDAHFGLIQMLAQVGRRSEAIAHFDKCSAFLRDALNVAPTHKLLVLMKQIRAGMVAPLVYSQGNGQCIPTTKPIEVILEQNVPSARRNSPYPIDPVPLLARDQELTRLNELLKSTLTGHGQVTFITGEAGRGKTALVQAFCQAAQARHEDLIVVGGSCNPHAGVGAPYAPFREIMAVLTNDMESIGEQGIASSMQAARLWDLFPSVVQAILEVGPALIDVLAPALPLLKQIEKIPDGSRWLKHIHTQFQHKYSMPQSPAMQQSLLCTQYMCVLERLAQQHPIILVLDHLQWADVDTIDMLAYIGIHAQNLRILIIGCYRPSELLLGQMSGGDNDCHALLPIIDELTRQFGNIEIALERDSDLEFVNAYLDFMPHRFDIGFRQLIDRTTAGNPLFVHELITSMRIHATLAQDKDGYWVADRIQEWALIPKRIEAILAEQVRRLPPHLHQLLVVASVIGDCFSAEVLAKVLAIDEQVVVQRLSGALTHQYRLICAQGVSYVGAQHICRYQFRQLILRHYLYRQLDNVQRPLLHDAVNRATKEMWFVKNDA